MSSRVRKNNPRTPQPFAVSVALPESKTNGIMRVTGGTKRAGRV